MSVELIDKQAPHHRLLKFKPLLAIVLSAAVALLLLTQLQSTSAQNGSCTGDYAIDVTLPTTARWQLCWEHSPEAGIVLSDIHFTTASTITRKVMEQANLAQIHTAYDDNSARHHYVTDDGLGSANLLTLDASDCPNGTLLQHNGQNVLCQLIEPRGYIYNHDDDQRQGDKLRLYSVSQINSQNFIVQWDLYDDGAIVPAIGNTGILSHYGSDAQYGWPLDPGGSSAGNNIGVGYTHNYYWRLDFDIGDNGANDVVEEFNVTPIMSRTRKTLAVTQIYTETGRTLNADIKRSWRVRDEVINNIDNHKISYHLEPLWSGNRYVGPSYEPWTNHDIYFTKDNACEQYVSHNPQTGGCGENVTDFTDGESIASADIVLWYRISFHHLPRDEDEAFIPVHWDSFELVPRDWTAVSPLE